MRKQLVMSLVPLLAAGLPMLFVTPQEAAATHPPADCACLDDDNDGTCGDAGDITVTDAALVGGPIVDLAKSFVIPSSDIPGQSDCHIVLHTAPAGGVRVTARRILIFGSLVSTPNGGEGVLFIAEQDVLVQDPLPLDPLDGRIISGGINKLNPNLAGNEAIAKSSVGLKAGTTCTFEDAELRGNPDTGSGQVGIRCEGNIEFSGTTILAAGIDIQSIGGVIDANCTGGGGGLIPLGNRCDDPATNLAGNGNNNGQQDPGDFPCTLDLGFLYPVPITFADDDEKKDFCGIVPDKRCNDFRARNNPLVMISKGDLRLQSSPPPAGPAPDPDHNFLAGRFLVSLVAENGNVLTNNSTITNDTDLDTVPAGAKIFVFPDPDSVNRLPVLKEKSFATTPSGTLDITGACYGPNLPIRIGQGTTVIGPPAGAPCAQFPADFIEVTSGP